MKIAYIYYSFYPITGGASVHGYYLARELTNFGYQLYKINGEKDPYTQKLPNKFTGLLWMLRNCDLFYIRMDYFLNLRNLVTRIALFFNKKIIVELNSPSDELYLFGKNKVQIEKVDRRMAAILKRVDAVIVVSKKIKKYCEEALGLENSYVIENGGEVFDLSENLVSSKTNEAITEIREQSDTIVVWSGSVNTMQHIEMMKEISNRVNNRVSFVIIAKGDTESLHQNFGANVYLMQDLDRYDVEYVISKSDIGLALYGDYSWSRWGFYNSSLKVFEYLNNGLETISNKEGTDIQKLYPNFQTIKSTDEIVTFIEEFEPDKKRSPDTLRTWKSVAEETSEIINKVYR